MYTPVCEQQRFIPTAQQSGTGENHSSMGFARGAAPCPGGGRHGSSALAPWKQEAGQPAQLQGAIREQTCLTDAWEKQTGRDRDGAPVKTDPCNAARTHHTVRVEAQPEPPPFYPLDVAVTPQDPSSHTTCLLLISSKHFLFRGFCLPSTPSSASS